MSNALKEVRFNELMKNMLSIDPILVMGDIGVDKYTEGVVKRISPEAPVPVLEVKKEYMILGLAANVSHNLSALKIKSSLVGVIGSDFNARHLQELLKEKEIDSDLLVVSKDRPTTFKERVTAETQQICRIDYESCSKIDSNIEENLYKNILKSLDSHSGIIIEDYGKGTLTDSLVKKIISLAKSSKKMVSIDPSRNSSPQIYTEATLLKPNLLEATLMTQALGYQEKSLEKISEILVEKLKLEKLIITLGSEGMGLIDVLNDGKLKYIPTVAKEVYDVSGAGDTAISLITAGILAGGNLEEAAWLGNCGSGVVVGKRGTAIVTTEELRDFYNRNIKNLYQ